jgi:hypothetical protein
VKRMAQTAVGLLAAGLYVWFAAVRSVGRVKRRKARRRTGAA